MKSSESSEKVSKPDWEDAYATLTPVLLAVLRRLARQGYISGVGQAMDYIHDFFTEAWPGIAERYDAARGPLKVYAAAAFARFARPRLVREARWNRALVEDSPEFVSPSDFGESVDADRVRRAFSKLDARDRELLAARFGPEHVSERLLAKQVGMTRYKFREAVATALARFSATLGERGVLDEFDSHVARLLFVEEHSIGAAAAELSCTESQVRAARRRILRALGKTSREAS
jgi:DNA-directed RNA polymerase specialized sigma24 family protein